MKLSQVSATWGIEAHMWQIPLSMDNKAQGAVSIMNMPTGKCPTPGPLALRFSAHVRMIMARDRITAQALAESAGLSRSYVGKRLRDEAAFTLNDVEVISNALGIHLPKL